MKTFHHVLHFALAMGLGGHVPLTAATLGPFEPLTRLPEERSAHQMVVINDHLIVVGGGMWLTVHSAEIGAGTIGPWQKTTPLPEGRNYVSVATWKNRIYVVAGQSGVEKQDVLCGTVDTNGMLGDWERMAGPPVAAGPNNRFGGSAVIHNDVLYYVGNWNQRGVYMCPLDAQGKLGAWQETAHLPSPRSGLCAYAIKDALYAFGGMVVFMKFTDTVFRAKIGPDGTLSKWRKADVLPMEMEGMASAVADDTLFLMGGSREGGMEDSVVACRFAATGDITEVKRLEVKLPQPMSWFGAAYHQGFVYISGGFVPRHEGKEPPSPDWSASVYASQVIEAKGVEAK